MKFSQQEKGFTLLEILVAITVAAILTGVSLNVYTMLHHGIVETSYGYIQFATENAQALRCRTRFVRGLPSCDSMSSEIVQNKVQMRF